MTHSFPYPLLTGRLGTAVVGAGLFLGLLGAARPDKAAPAPKAAAAVESTSGSAEAEPAGFKIAANTPAEAGAELMHDVADDGAESPAAAPEAVAASAKIAKSITAKRRQLLMEVTAYCACKKCCGPKAQGITASGKTIRYNGGRFVAADTKVLPFGRKIVIPGYADGKAVEVIDRGGAIKGNHIDVFFASHEQARQWGRQQLLVTITD